MRKFSFLPQAILALFLLSGKQLVAQSITENFTPYESDTVQVLSAESNLGSFNYSIFNKGLPSEESSLLCQFEGDGSILIGFKSKVTEVRIINKNKKEISFQGFRASLINSYNNESVFYSIEGFRNGKSVTLSETVEINTVKLPGTFVSLAHLPGFDKVDEIRISGDDIKLTIEEFVYKNEGSSEVGVTASN